MQKSLNKELKEERRKGNKFKIGELTSKIKVENYKEELLRNLTFTIAWQIFNGKREVIARLYTGEKGRKETEGKGFDAILQAAEDINQHVDRFALISDLTNNIQIGDLLVIRPDRLEIVEIKIGEKNEEAFRVLNFYKVNNLKLSKGWLERSFDPKFAEQILRIQKQKDKTKKAKIIIETDQGVDPKHPETFVRLMDNSIADKTYHKELFDIITNLDEKDWAYTNIMGIINIGAYKNDWRICGKEILKEINNKYPVYDLMSSLGITIAEPIFAKPIDDDKIMDIAFGKIKIYVGINFDMFIEFCNDFKLPMRWSTTKEFGKFLKSTSGYNKEIFSFKNRGLIIEDQETKGKPMFVGHGMLLRMIFDQIRPETLVLNRKLGFEKFKNEFRKD